MLTLSRSCQAHDVCGGGRWNGEIFLLNANHVLMPSSGACKIVRVTLMTVTSHWFHVMLCRFIAGLGLRYFRGSTERNGRTTRLQGESLFLPLSAPPPDGHTPVSVVCAAILTETLASCTAGSTASEASSDAATFVVTALVVAAASRVRAVIWCPVGFLVRFCEWPGFSFCFSALPSSFHCLLETHMGGVDALDLNRLGQQHVLHPMDKDFPVV